MFGDINQVWERWICVSLSECVYLLELVSRSVSLKNNSVSRLMNLLKTFVVSHSKDTPANGVFQTYST